MPDIHMLGFPGSSAGEESACNAGDLGLVPWLGKSPGEGIGYPLQCSWASLVAQIVKNLLAIQETRVPWVGKIPSRRAWQPILIFLPGESHEQRNLEGYGPSVQSLSRVWLFVTPWTTAHQVSLSITNSQSLLKLTSIALVMPSNHLILCCPLLLMLSIFPSIRVFSNESVLCIRWPKYWSFSFSISPSGLISFRMDWLDLLAVQGTLKSLLQHHSDSAGKESACNAGDLDSVPGFGRSSGEGKAYPLQYSGLENFMDCIVHRIPWDPKELDVTDWLSLSQSTRSQKVRTKHSTAHICVNCISLISYQNYAD